MPATGLFFLPTTTADSSPLPTLLNALTAHYDPTPLPPWSLHHRIFRDQKPPSTTSDGVPGTGPRYLQILSLSHHPTTSYVAITRTSSLTTNTQTRVGTPASSGSNGGASGAGTGDTSTEPASIIAIPAGASTEEFVQLLLAKFGPLWTQRQTLGVRNGLAFGVGGFVVRVGEVVQGGSAGVGARGVVVEVAWRGCRGGGGESDGVGLVQAFWDSLGVRGLGSVSVSPGWGRGLEL
ncbi:hypothetical protein G7Y79_00008g024610 [Physcia stellaris]|nr:hypothetical protein G7Y79_00008g024610 [Physcia stellaris]